MSLPLAIALIVLADIALIALLVFVMWRASKLTPHFTDAETPQPQLALARRTQRQQAHGRRAPLRTSSRAS